jgi:hypothetical protein
LAGKTVPGAQVVLLDSKSGPAPTTEELLGKAKDEASLPRVLSPPEVAAVLEKELKRPGDVTTILEERDRFEVVRLIAITKESRRVDAVRFPKVDFDSWLKERARRASIQQEEPLILGPSRSPR